MGHESTIEHASFTFRVSGISRALTHQLVRHRIASYSQRSQRYCKEDGFNFVMPPMEYLDNEKNISPEQELTQRVYAQDTIIDAIMYADSKYEQLLRIGVNGEDARFVLPNACETKIVITMNARELRHFLRVRMDKHAQWEIRRMAHLMWDLLMIVAAPLFEDLYELHGKYKEECPHYESQATREGRHWCGDRGEYIEECQWVCDRFNKLMFNEGDDDVELEIELTTGDQVSHDPPDAKLEED